MPQLLQNKAVAEITEQVCFQIYITLNWQNILYKSISEKICEVPASFKKSIVIIQAGSLLLLFIQTFSVSRWLPGNEQWAKTKKAHLCFLL